MDQQQLQPVLYQLHPAGLPGAEGVPSPPGAALPQHLPGDCLYQCPGHPHGGGPEKLAPAHVPAHSSAPGCQHLCCHHGGACHAAQLLLPIQPHLPGSLSSPDVLHLLPHCLWLQHPPGHGPGPLCRHLLPSPLLRDSDRSVAGWLAGGGSCQEHLHCCSSGGAGLQGSFLPLRRDPSLCLWAHGPDEALLWGYLPKQDCGAHCPHLQQSPGHVAARSLLLPHHPCCLSNFIRQSTFQGPEHLWLPPAGHLHRLLVHHVLVHCLPRGPHCLPGCAQPAQHLLPVASMSGQSHHLWGQDQGNQAAPGNCLPTGTTPGLQWEAPVPTLT